MNAGFYSDRSAEANAEPKSQCGIFRGLPVLEMPLSEPPSSTVPESAPPESAPPESAPPGKRASWLLLAGAGFGLALASLGLLEDRRDTVPLPSEAAARVGERLIRHVDYQRVVAGVASDLRSPTDDAMRRRVLERMIDEELLVQRALELGLAVVDRRVRGELTSGLIDSIVAEVEGRPPSDRDVELHFDENIEFFTRPGRLRARTLFFSTRRDGEDPRGGASSRVVRARERLLRGDAPDAVEESLADPQVSRLPDTLLPPSKVRDYTGPAVLSSLLDLSAGEWSEVLEAQAGFVLANVVDREPASVPELSEIEALVREDLERRRGDLALRRYLDDLRQQVPIAIDESIFEPTVPLSSSN